MMISPESYYELEIKGKSAEEIRREIDELKKEIGDLKYKMEDPDYKPERVSPSDETVLYWTREYLAMAKKALLEAGGEYIDTEEDKRAATFLEKLPFMTKLEFSYGGFGPYEPIIIECDSESLIWNVERPVPLMPYDSPLRTRTELLKRIRELHLEEWESDYWPDKYGITVLDGIQWELTLEYGNGHEPWKSFGSNAYPFNFREFLEMLGEDYRFFDEDLEDDEYGDDEEE